MTQPSLRGLISQAYRDLLDAEDAAMGVAAVGVGGGGAAVIGTAGGGSAARARIGAAGARIGAAGGRILAGGRGGGD